MKAAKKIVFLAFCLLLLPFGAFAAPGPAQSPPELFSSSAILIDADTGQVLFEKNARQPMEPASLTKIMTCLIAMEEGRLEDLVPVSAQALALEPDASRIGLTEGERLTLEQMLYAMMLPSANDAANAVAIHLAGSLPAFVKRMNQRARELGLASTHFENANGLPAEGHFSTAYDLAQITRAALSHPEFESISGTERYSVPATGHNRPRQFTHLNRMLQKESGFYDTRAIAGKTGWTASAGFCLMTAAREDGVRLIAVCLKPKGASMAIYQDTAALFRYGFSGYRRVSLELPRTGLAANLSEGPYLVTGGGSAFPLLIPESLDESDLQIEVFVPAGNSRAEEGELRGEVLLVNRQTGQTILKAGRVSLQAAPPGPDPEGNGPILAAEWLKKQNHLIILLGLGFAIGSPLLGRAWRRRTRARA